MHTAVLVVLLLQAIISIVVLCCAVHALHAAFTASSVVFARSPPLTAVLTGGRLMRVLCVAG